MPTLTHFIRYDQPRTGRLVRAFCGQLVPFRDFSAEPTCPRCRRAMDEDDRAFDAFTAPAADTPVSDDDDAANPFPRI